MAILNQRLLGLDLFRGVAIILMMLFHLSFDLNHFRFIEIDIYGGMFWKYARWVIVSMFLLAVGYSLYLAYNEKIIWEKVFKRLRTLTLYAVLISVVTYFIFPTSWIYFGVLHFILLASLLGLLFVRIPWIALLTSVIIFAGSFFGWLHTVWLYKFLQPLLMLPRHAEDLVPLFPWFGCVLLGIFLASKNVIPQVPSIKVIQKIAFLGRHSLIIYMVHQPLFFGVLLLVTQFFL